MTLDQLLVWVDRQIADFSPQQDELRNRFSQTLQAYSFDGGSVFGFKIPCELVAEATPAIRARLDAALAAWKQFLTTVDGGPDYYERSLVAAGITPPTLRPLKKDPAITAAVRALEARLADTKAATAAHLADGRLEADGEHAYGIAPPVTGMDVEDELPSPLEALYAELGGLWVGEAEPGEGGRTELADSYDRYLFVPFNLLFDDWATRFDDWHVFDRHPDSFSWTMIDVNTGAIARANKIDRTPKQIAGSLVEYLGQLAESYG